MMFSEREFNRATQEFVYVFSRMEYALKRAGYYNDSKNGYIDVSWDKFVNSLENGFFDNNKDSEDFKYLVEFPPKKLGIQSDEKGSEWLAQKCPQTALELFVAVRRVRNNLFHGGKYHGQQLLWVSRNDALIRACLGVLKTAREAHCEVNDAFSSR